MIATRKQVYNAIDGERAYQETKWKRPAHNHSATEYMVYIQTLAHEALVKVSHEDGEHAAHDAMRKIAALAVSCMEEHGPVLRLQQ